MSWAQGVVLLVVGLLFVGAGWTLGIQGQQQAVDSADATVEGTVVTSKVVRVASSGQNSGGWSYDPRVTYRYSYDGRTYRSDNIYAGPGEGMSGLDQSEARDFVGEYPAGSTVTVHVDSDNPSQSFLEEDSPTPEWGFYVFIAIGGLIALGGVWGILRSLVGVVT